MLINGKKIMLKPMDARLLQLLCVKMHEVAGNEYLIQGLWGKFRGENKENALRKSVKHLRDILEADASLMVGNSYLMLLTGRLSRHCNAVGERRDKIVDTGG